MVKVLSNFDTELDIKLFDQCVAKYTNSEVLLVRRDNLFFVFHVIVPAICFIILTLAMLAVMYFWNVPGMNGIKNKVMLGVWFLLFLVFFKNTLMNAIDYKLDFAIATPCELIAYEQTGFWNRSGQTVESQKIKTVTVNKTGILASLFNVGDIIILSEGDKSGNGDIELEFIHNPDKVAQQMKEIFNDHDKFTGSKNND